MWQVGDVSNLVMWQVTKQVVSSDVCYEVDVYENQLKHVWQPREG